MFTIIYTVSGNLETDRKIPEIRLNFQLYGSTAGEVSFFYSFNVKSILSRNKPESSLRAHVGVGPQNAWVF